MLGVLPSFFILLKGEMRADGLQSGEKHHTRGTIRSLYRHAGALERDGYQLTLEIINFVQQAAKEAANANEQF